MLSTSWVLKYGYEDTAERLPHALRERVIGATYHSVMHKDDFRTLPRWQQIVQDYGRRKPSAWIALDDDHEGWPDPLRDNYVMTDPVEGLSKPSVLQDLQMKLRQHFEPV